MLSFYKKVYAGEFYKRLHFYDGSQLFQNWVALWKILGCHMTDYVKSDKSR